MYTVYNIISTFRRITAFGERPKSSGHSKPAKDLLPFPYRFDQSVTLAHIAGHVVRMCIQLFLKLLFQVFQLPIAKPQSCIQRAATRCTKSIKKYPFDSFRIKFVLSSKKSNIKYVKRCKSM